MTIKEARNVLVIKISGTFSFPIANQVRILYINCLNCYHLLSTIIDLQSFINDLSLYMYNVLCK